MLYAVELCRHRIFPLPVVDAEDVDGYAAAAIYIFLAVIVVQLAPLALFKSHGETRICPGDVLLIFFYYTLSVHFFTEKQCSLLK